jgi:MFS family permease
VPSPTRRILLASLVGSTIEFFDFYTYGNAAVLVFPRLFFPASDPAAAMLQSLATFAIAFFARPLGSVLFGHFGDRVGRKATLVAALMTMGISTVAVGLLPTYAAVGAWAPLLLALCRFGQGLGLGGEWGGAVLLATENAPPARQAWYGMFPQLGAPLGFLLSAGGFLLLGRVMGDARFLEVGWRLPFLASALLVAVGLYVRLRVTETPAFEAAMRERRRVRVPVLGVLSGHGAALLRGTLLASVSFQLFYLVTVFGQSWAIAQFHLPRDTVLLAQLVSVLALALAIPLSALLADRFGGRRTLIGATLGIFIYGLAFASLFDTRDPVRLALCMSLGLLLMGASYGPLGAVLGRFFPTELRYTGLSVSFNLAGIVGASPAPYLAVSLAHDFGLPAVGTYLAAGASLSLLALLAARE